MSGRKCPGASAVVERVKDNVEERRVTRGKEGDGEREREGVRESECMDISISGSSLP